MKTAPKWTIALLICTAPLLSAAQESLPASDAPTSGITDEQNGQNARAWLQEQAEGINRGETEAYRAESAGKAYRAYVDSIGTKEQALPESEISKLSTK